MFIVLVPACKPGPAHEEAAGPAPELVIPDVDSLQLVFYDDPEGDPKRYSRFFRHTSLAEPGEIAGLLRDLSGGPDTREKLRPCRSEGKFYLFSGGEPVRTVYFSTGDGDCNYLYIIHNGDFLYYHLDSGNAARLKTWRSRLYEAPPSAG